FAGTEPEFAFERLTESRVRPVPCCKRNFCNVYCPHAQFASRPFQAHTAHISRNVLAYMRCENAMKVGDRETGNFGQCFAAERFVDMRANVAFDLVDMFGIALHVLDISYHKRIINYQNTCSLV